MTDLKELGGVLVWHIKHNRKTAMLWAGAVMILVVEAVIYFPLHAAATRVALRTSAINSQMEMARSSGLTQISATELAKLQSRMSYFKEGFVNPTEIPAILNRISDQAEKNSVRVLNINSDSPVPMDGSASGASDAAAHSGQKFIRLPIHVLLEGQYKSFAEFLNSLNRSSQQVFVVESYTIKKTKESGALNCDLILSFFTTG